MEYSEETFDEMLESKKKHDIKKALGHEIECLRRELIEKRSVLAERLQESDELDVLYGSTNIVISINESCKFIFTVDTNNKIIAFAESGTIQGNWVTEKTKITDGEEQMWDFIGKRFFGYWHKLDDLAPHICREDRVKLYSALKFPYKFKNSDELTPTLGNPSN